MIYERIATQTGSVQLVDVMGSPLSVVNSARVSMGKQADDMSEADWRLIDYLWSHEHTSPFRHVQFQFHVKAPVFVLRQWMKHQIGCAWNEISGRYVQFDHEAWSPDAWRAQADKIKQGSAGPMAEDDALRAQMIYDRAIEASFRAYEELLSAGVCKEQARACLPLSLMSECYWSCSLHALIHFLKLRLDHHAQVEIRAYARAVRESVSAVEGMPRLLSIALA
jgi:thymidylate synthase (FAD)